MNKVYVGLDLGSRECQLLALTANGEVHSRQRFATSESNLRRAVIELQGEVHVHLEVGELAVWACDVLKPLVARVLIGDPRHNAWIAKDPNKNDRVDGYKLAELLRLGRVHEVYYQADLSRRAFKLLVQHYEDLVCQQTRLKNKLKSRLRVQGLIRRGRRVYSEQGRQEMLTEISLPEVRESIEQLYQLLYQTIAQRQKTEQLLAQAAKKFPEIALFLEVPGVGLISAARFSAYLQTPHRFSSKRKLWRYARLGVAQQSSDGKALTRPRLDKTSGCGALKALSRTIFQAALRRKDDNAFKRAYQASLLRTHNPTHARLNVQRKIIAVLRAIWISGAHYHDQLS
jgi:transposase